MLPKHRGRNGVYYKPLNTILPFDVDYEPNTAGDAIVVTLRSNASTQFRGFMLEARDGDTDHIVGQFHLLQSDRTRLLTCNNRAGSAVSNKGNIRKTSIKVQWKPQKGIKNIIFRVTFVESLARFWQPVNVILPPTTTPSTTTSTTTLSTTTGTTTPSTTTGTTTLSTTTGTTTPSTTTGTTTLSTTTGTTTPSTTTGTTTPSTTTGTTTSSTTTGTTTSSTTTSTTTPSMTTGTTTSSTTTGTTTLSTTIGTTTPSTTTSSKTPKPSTAEPDKTSKQPFNLLGGVGTGVMNLRSAVVVVRMELPNLYLITLVNSPCSHHLSKVLKILCCLFCAAVEILALILFCLADSINITLVALLCVAMAINFIELVIICLPIGPSHELKEISDFIVQVCSAIHGIFTIAVIFVGVLENDNCGKNRKDSWLLKVMIAYSVWILLFVICFLMGSTQRKTILGRSKKKKRRLAAAKGINALSVFFMFGTICFAVAVTFGVFWCQEK
ncbi:uncharacterized protein LOC121941235 [Plectropomus leopardus]|uniref:uncharacterized protein LOC121941235 n=1 Tax=Plectropomus leopardus TaxID=160734 RepID=UPI001C4CDA36|nr:uncharacterized protein LOC121941235 [Plectropomus leopardus]